MKWLVMMICGLGGVTWANETEFSQRDSLGEQSPAIMSLKRDQVVFSQTADPLPVNGWFSYLAADRQQRIADDFQLSETTTVTRVLAYGSFGARTFPFNYAMLEIYSNVSGLPGALLYSEMFEMPDPNLTGMIEVAPSDLVLDAGQYWVSIYDYSDQFHTEFEWFWYFETSVLFGQPAAATQDGITWFTAATENVFQSSTMFQIYGDDGVVGETPTIASPAFLSNANFYNDANDNLFCQFPDPNGDQAYRGNGRLAWEISFTEDCELLGSAIIDQSNWPFGVSVPHPSDGLYLIEVRRMVLGSKMPDTSPPYVQPGPNASNPSNEINPRYVLHVPKIGGGFKGVIRIANPNPVDSAAMLLLAYNTAGQEVASVAISVPASQSRSYGIYEAPANLSVNATYFSGFRDNLAFVEAREIKSDLTEVLMTYYSLQSGVGADVAAAKASDGGSVGLEFNIQSGNPSSAYWDGVAVLNLDDTSADVWVSQLDSGGNLLGQRKLGDINPDSKVLSVISDLFPFVPYSQFVIESRNGVYIQVLGLNGSFDNAVLKDSKISKKR